MFGLRGHEIRLELDLGSVFDVIGATYKISTNMGFNFYKGRDDIGQTPHLRGLLSVGKCFSMKYSLL